MTRTPRSLIAALAVGAAYLAAGADELAASTPGHEDGPSIPLAVTTENAMAVSAGHFRQISFLNYTGEGYDRTIAGYDAAPSPYRTPTRLVAPGGRWPAWSCVNRPGRYRLCATGRIVRSRGTAYLVTARFVWWQRNGRSRGKVSVSSLTRFR